MSRADAGRRAAVTAPPSPPRPPGIALSAPAMIAAALVAAACIVLSVTYKIFDPDIWQHITVGKAIWQLHEVPRTQLWSWPTYGAPDVDWSWGFSALIWPVWERAGVWGLFAWRWVTTLTAFGLLWATARRMGARDFVPLVVMVMFGLVWRQRSMARPETLAGVLLAAEVWILETRRQGGKDHAWWLIPIAWAWANVHNTCFLGFGVIGAFLLDDLVSRRGRAGARAPGGRGRLLGVGLACFAISFVNPYGWRTLWQPFDFFLHQRNEIIFSAIAELAPVEWARQWAGLPILFAAWPLLTLARTWKKGLDVVEPLLCLAFSAIALRSQRFLGFYALAAAPYVARDVAEWLGALRPVPRTSAALRAALASLVCVAISLPEWQRPWLSPGVGFVWNQYPVAACDFMEAHGVRGRGFNNFGFAGYQLYRFWPDRGRLPFMDIHQSGTKQDREQYGWAQQRPDTWRALDGRYAFDYSLLPRTSVILDFLDADSTWALVFLDDVMAIHARRSGPLAAVAREFSYRRLPAGREGLGALGEACARDSVLRGETRAELEREVQGSPYHAQALTLLANIALVEARFADARSLLERALAVDPNRTDVHWRLAMIALREARPQDALREVALERRVVRPAAMLDVLEGRAWRALGEDGRARDAFRRALARDSSYAEARDSLAAIARGGRT